MKRKTVYLLLTALAVVYAALSIILPPDPASLQKYHLSVSQNRLLVLTIIIPIVAIWWAAAYGYANLKQYAKLVKKSGEGQSIDMIANGLGILALSLPVTQTLSTVLAYFARVHPRFLSTSKIINIYLAIALALVAFMLISRGAMYLTRTIKSANSRYTYNFLMLLFIVLTALYSYFVFTNGSRRSAAAYAMPDFLILFTVVVPYLYIWYLGFITAIRMHYYQNSVGGMLYKKSLLQLTYGVSGVIAASIVIQFLVAVSNNLLNLGLSTILGIIYVLLAIMSVGYIFIAFGSKKLTKIEEV